MSRHHSMDLCGRWFKGIGVVLLLLTCSCAKSTPRGPSAIDPDAAEEFTTTDSGLKYRILRRGDGPKPTAADEVTVDYTGWLDNQQVFDTSYGAREPPKFPLRNVIPGWTEGLQLVNEGGMIELEIPSELGYGAKGAPPNIPPNATLHFKVELHDVE